MKICKTLVKRGSSINSDHVLKFQDIFDCCSLTDLGFCGPKFTWARKCGNVDFIQKSLDRVVVNSKE